MNFNVRNPCIDCDLSLPCCHWSKYHLFNFLRNKRKVDEEQEEIEDQFYRPYKHPRVDDDDDEIINFISCTTTSIALLDKKKRKERGANKIRRNSEWWVIKYRDAPPAEFKKTMRINRETFDMILNSALHRENTDQLQSRPNFSRPVSFKFR
jgi:hypothetical protein